MTADEPQADKGHERNQCSKSHDEEDVIDDSVLDGADEVVIGRRLFKGDLKENIKNFDIASLRH